MKKKNMGMKKLLAAVLCAGMVLSGCGSTGNENTDTVPTVAEENQATDNGQSGSETVPGGAAENGTGEAYSLNATSKNAAEAVINGASEMTKRAVKSLGNTRRLQQVIERMQNGEEVTVAFLGGSITEGYKVNENQNYAKKTTRWLQESFANQNIKLVNAGLSGTPSTIGLMRVQKDVLDHQPDLVFVEFAVNDAQDTTSKMMYESLVNRIINSESAPAVVLIFTVLKNGYTCEEVQDDIGEAYNLPMISVNAALAPEFDAGTMKWEDYSLDESHPNKDGHVMISGFIQYLFAQTMLKTTLDEAMDYTVCKAVGSPYADMKFYNNANLYLTEIGGFREASSDISHFPYDWIWGKEAGGSLKFTMNGKNLLMLYKEANSANMAAVEVYIDGKLKSKVNANSPDGWNNPQFALILNEVSEAEHEVEIKIADDTVDKNFHILGFATTGEIHAEERVNEEDIPYQERAIVNVGNTYRLEQLLARAQAGEDLTIGFIGGSITQGSGASNANKCYAKLTYDWWVKTFPQSNFTFVNAGIGATTSQFACARAYSDLLAYDPDFVVIDFSVNDSGSTMYGQAYESLVNMIWDHESAPAVMMLNMVQYDSGNNTQSLHNKIAESYQIPAVSMKNSIFKEIVFGNLKATDVSADMLHPNDKGHAYTSEIITYFIEKVMNGVYHSDAEAVKPAEAVYGLNFMKSTRYDNRNSEPVLNGFTADTTKQNGVADIFKNGYTAKDTGASIKFENIKGSKLSLQYRKTNSLGAPLAVAIIDGDEAHAIELDGNFPNGWGNWLYLHDLADGLDAETPHTVEIRITEGTNKDFYLVSVIGVE